MNYMSTLYFIFEIVGTIAFASSGAMVAIQKEMDIFGVCVLGVTTACGGGLIRDLILGISPPGMFMNPSYTIISIIICNIIFHVLYIKQDILVSKFQYYYDLFMLWFDTVGLGVFTVIGVNKAMYKGYTEWFLLLFVGVITGVGGGLLRDIMAQRNPVIFTKHIYASASLLGAFVYILSREYYTELTAMMAGIITIVVVRFVAVQFRLNLPKIKINQNQ